jgi:hypothetical protein
MDGTAEDAETAESRRFLSELRGFSFAALEQEIRRPGGITAT